MPSDELSDDLSAWGGTATFADFAGHEQLWEYCLALQRLLQAEVSQLSLHIEDQEYPIGDVKLAYVANAAVNAIAGEWGGQESIALFSGTALRLMAVAQTVMANPQLMSTIGSTAGEQASDADVRAILDPRTPIIVAEPPADPLRAAYANALTVIGIHYVFAHELAHLAMGHVAHIATGGSNAGAFLEYDAATPRHRGARDRLQRFLEFEADTGAVMVSMPFVLDVVRTASLNPFSPGSGTCADLVTLWASGVGLVYTVLHHANARSGSHPPPIPRYYNAMMLGLSVAVQRQDECAEAYGDAVAQAHSALKRLWSVAGTESLAVRVLKRFGWRRSWPSIMNMDDDVPEEEQRRWYELAKARAERRRSR